VVRERELFYSVSYFSTFEHSFPFLFNQETYMQRILIEKMISNDPKKRPTTKEILSYPMFWSKAKILQFLQDVSDRIEKLDPSDPILVDLEKNASSIIKNNWRMHICVPLQNGNLL
jgi:serine/threonine protein kinase